MRRSASGLVLRVLGVGVLVWLAWRRSARSHDPWWLVALAAIALVGVVVGAVWWGARRDSARRARLGASRPGLTTHAVWADTTLAQGLRDLEVDPGTIRTGTRLTLAWSTTDVQIWRGDQQVAAVGWDQVWTITPTTGRAASTPNPAIEMVTRLGVRLVLIPARRPDGGLLPARAAGVEMLVGRLRAARAAVDGA